MIPSGASPCVAEQSNFEVQIRSIETHAYASVLRAFSAQSDALTWVNLSCTWEMFFSDSTSLFWLHSCLIYIEI